MTRLSENRTNMGPPSCGPDEITRHLTSDVRSSLGCPAWVPEPRLLVLAVTSWAQFPVCTASLVAVAARRRWQDEGHSAHRHSSSSKTVPRAASLREAPPT